MLDLKDLMAPFVGQVVGGFWSHLNLRRYAALRYLESRRGSATYGTEEEFWRDLIGPSFYRGNARERELAINDVIELKGFQLTEWIPRAPGVFWTIQGDKSRRAARDYRYEAPAGRGPLFKPEGKMLMVLGGGMGTNRLLPHQGQDGQYRLLCATSSGRCDAGIPVILREEVYAAIQERLAERQGLEVDLTGRLASLPFDPQEIELQKRRGIVSEMEEPIREYLTTTLHVPRYVLLVESSLSVKSYISDFRLSASAWTCFRAVDENTLKPYYSFTYTNFDPRDEATIQQAAERLLRYTRYEYAEKIYTDFDEHVQRLRDLPWYPLASIMSGDDTGDPEEIDQMVSLADEVLERARLDKHFSQRTRDGAEPELRLAEPFRFPRKRKARQTAADAAAKGKKGKR